MGYLDTDGFYVYEESEIADPGNGFSDLLNKAARALPAAIRTRVVAEMGDSDTISDVVAAELAEQIAAAMILPKIIPSGEYLRAEITPSGAVTYATRKDGFVEIPLAMIGGARLYEQPSGEYLKATVSPSGLVMEDALGLDGSVPNWVIRRWQERMGIASDPGYDIGLIAGQSNSLETQPYPAPVRLSDPRVYRWNATLARIELVSTSDTSLGAEWARAHAAATGRRTLYVPTGVGSTGFTTTSLNPPPAGYQNVWGGTWDRSLTADSSNLATRSLTTARAAIAAAGEGSRLVVLAWAQGEADTAVIGGTPVMSQAQYAAKLDDYLTWMRTELNAPALPVVVRSMVPEWITQETALRPGTAGIAAAHVDTVRRLPGTAYVFGPTDLFAHDQNLVHYSAAGMIAGGQLIEDALVRARANTEGVVPLPPRNLAVTRSGDTATVTWDAPACRVTAYTLQAKIGNGAWTTVPLARPVDITATLTVPSASALALRMTTTNPFGTSGPTTEVHA